MDVKHFFCSLINAGLILAILSACADNTAQKQAAEPKITTAELLSHCPLVEFQDGAAFYNVYAPGGQGSPDKVVYQAVISNLTRSCQYPEGRLQMRVGAAGRIVPGPAFRPAAIAVPIEVKVMQGTQMLFSRRYKYTVADGKPDTATQFIFGDDKIFLPRSAAQNVKVYIGFSVGRQP